MSRVMIASQRKSSGEVEDKEAEDRKYGADSIKQWIGYRTCTPVYVADDRVECLNTDASIMTLLQPTSRVADELVAPLDCGNNSVKNKISKRREFSILC